MGLCDIVLRINTVDPETGEATTKPVTLSQKSVDQDAHITFEQAADAIIGMSEDLRMQLIGDLVASKASALTNEMIKTGRYVGNITIQGLVDKYPGLKDAIDMDTESMSSYTILYKPTFNISGHNYSGRVITSDGQEVFIVKNYYSALNLFRFIQAKERAIDVFEGNGTIPEGITQEMLDDLKVIAGKKKLSMADTVIDYLTNRSSYKSDYAADNGRIIRTAYTMANIAGVLADDYETFKTKYTEFEQSLYAQTVMHGSKYHKYEWVVAKSKLYATIVSYNPSFADQCSEDQFNKFNEKEMQAKLKETGVFLGNPKLERAEIKNVDKTPEEGEKKNKSKPVAYVTLSFPFKRLGALYNFGFDTESIFSPVTEGVVEDGRHKGMYVYKATFQNGKTEYFISRSLISPESYANSYKSLDEALKGIDKHIAKDKISEYAFLEFRQGEEGTVPRTVEIGKNKVREGQIVTVRNDMLLKKSLKELQSSFRTLFDLTVPELVEMFKRSDGTYRLEGIDKLITPEQAGTFLYKLATEVLTKEDFDSVTSSAISAKALVDLICKIGERAQTVLENALSEENGRRHYLVENLYVNHSTGRSTAVLKLLRHGGVDISDDVRTVGDLNVGDFISLTLTNAINFFAENYGIKVHSETTATLKQLSIDKKLGFENRADSVRAFIYNGEIYINKSVANVKDLYHEISHLYLGVLKEKYPDMYEKLMNHYAHNATDGTIRKRFADTVARIGQEYQTLAMQDLEEEAVVRMIANELYRDSALSLDGFDGSVYQSLMNSISTTVDMFTKEAPNEDLMFGTLMSDLGGLQEKTKRKRLLTNFIQQKLQSEASDKIIEKCD